MAYESNKTVSIKATASLATKQYTFVKLDSSGQITTPSAAASAIGVLQDKPAAGDPGAVCLSGSITKILCGGNFNAGGAVCTDGNGAAVAATSGGYVLGVALSAGATGFITTIIFQPQASKM